MKNIFSLFLAVFLVFALAACGGNEVLTSSQTDSASSKVTPAEVFTAPELDPLPALWGTKPTVSWSTLKGGATARIVVETEDGEVFIDKKDLTGTSYTLEKELTVGKTYVLKAFYNRGGTEFSMIGISKKGKQIFCFNKKVTTLKDISKKIENSKDYLITFIGDSVTWGAGKSSDEKSYPAFFARKLAEKFPDRAITRYDGIMNGERVPLKEYSEPFPVQKGTAGKITVVRSGVGSSEATHIINRMDSDFIGTANGRLPKKADLFVIHLGINDQGHGASAEEFKERLLKLGTLLLKKQPETDVIFMTPTSSVGSSNGTAAENPLNFHSKKMIEAAQELGFPVIDIHALWMEHYVQGKFNFGMGDWHYDRWHPSDKGYEAMANKIFEDLFN